MDGDTDFLWENLLIQLDEGTVVPIIGQELAVSDDGRQWHRELARLLATELKLPADELPESPTLNDVFSACLQRGRPPRKELYARLQILARRLTFPPPTPLRQLAAIRAFKLFVTTSFDPLLVQALDAERNGGRPGGADVIAFAPSVRPPVDLPGAVRDLHRPIVFQVFGRLAAEETYAVTEEDLIEFFFNLQTDAIRPKKLFDELHNSHLLLIGNAFPDWLARFLIRLAKCERILTERTKYEYLVATPHQDDKSLLTFLRSFSRGTQFFESHDPATFIAELHRRWTERHPDAATPAPKTSATGGDAPAVTASDMIDGAIFLSYASENRPVCDRLRETLDSGGMEVWFDRQQLQGGDAWDQKIRRNIQHSSLFLPLISRDTSARREGYFRLEWRLARERMQRMASDRVFIVPCIIDDSPEALREAALEFPDIQHMFLPGGVANQAAVDRIRQHYRNTQRREAAG